MMKTRIDAKLTGLILAVISVLMAACSMTSATSSRYQPDWYEVSTVAHFRPVSTPGTQRRVAQKDAEDEARRLIHEHVGSMPAGKGKTVNDVIGRDAQLRAAVLGIVRNAEVRDWKVCQQECKVQVWLRIDLNQVRAIVAQCR
jgi:hypothetical protein